jgi:hypothetical protein
VFVCASLNAITINTSAYKFLYVSGLTPDICSQYGCISTNEV